MIWNDFPVLSYAPLPVQEVTHWHFRFSITLLDLTVTVQVSCTAAAAPDTLSSTLARFLLACRPRQPLPCEVLLERVGNDGADVDLVAIKHLEASYSPFVCAIDMAQRRCPWDESGGIQHSRCLHGGPGEGHETILQFGAVALAQVGAPLVALAVFAMEMDKAGHK